MIESVARALHYAHEQHVIHRDIKPSNIMVTPEGEGVVLDFGLAKILEEEVGDRPLTQPGELLGTPQYMSPEQLAAHRIPLDRRTDVYSLGVTLYECVTLRRPFEGPSREALYRSIMTQEPMQPRKLSRNVPRDLEVVLLTALEKDVYRRYQTALDFADDLARVNRRETINARPAGPLLRFRRWYQRNPVLATSILALFLSLAGGLAVSLHFLRQIAEQRNELDTQSVALTQASESNQVLADAMRARRRLAEAEGLFPPRRALVPSIDQWCVAGEELLGRHAGSGSEGSGVTPVRGDSDPDMAAARAALRPDLEDLRRKLKVMRARLKLARAIHDETIGKHRGEWERLAEVLRPVLGNGGRSELLSPIEGLVPLGPDPASGLEEFAAFGTGRIPRRDPRSRVLERTPDMAAVLVLVPGGETSLGSPPEETPRSKNEEPWTVVLRPYLIGKFEVTQAQWLAVMGTNPAFGQSGRVDDVETHVGHPVENVSWSDGREFARRIGAVLPSEAQWEHACRAGRRSAWTHGDESEDLRGRTNLCGPEILSLLKGKYPITDPVPWDDGFPMHAPAGSFVANAFGLHDCHGNVSEWCRDSWQERRESDLEPGDGVFETGGGAAGDRVYRGGNWQRGANSARSAYRRRRPAGSKSPLMGFRIAWPVR